MVKLFFIFFLNIFDYKGKPGSYIYQNIRDGKLNKVKLTASEEKNVHDLSLSFRT